MQFFNESKVPVTEISGLLERVKSFVPSGYRFDSIYLRGQADESWGLRPTIGRLLRYAGLMTDGYRGDREQYLLDRFRRYIHPHVSREVGGRELLFLARHHGLPVRLLDWTSNPLVALYYACVGDEYLNTPGAVWVTRRCQHQHDVFYKFYEASEEPLKLRGVKIVYAPYVSPRIPAQSCNFTIQDDPAKDLDTYDPTNYQQDEFDLELVEKWIVPPDRKCQLLHDLERCAINERSLFPDLDGIARGLVRSEVIRTGK